MDSFRRLCLSVFKTKKKKKKQLNHYLCDDLVFLIVLRLPLKHAIRCKVLNKYLYDLISHPSFKHKHALVSSRTHSYNHHNTILYKPEALLLELVPVTHLWRKGKFTVLASSNGLLLLSISTLSNNIVYYLFNPITGQALAVNHHRMHEFDGSRLGVPGLVVNLSENESDFHQHPSFKLVTIKKTRNRLRFKVIVSSGSSSTRVKSRVDFLCGSFTWIDTESLYLNGTTLHDYDNQTRPVYLNGGLHWLGGDLKHILVFDVEKERAMIIKGPAGLIIRDTITSWLCVWFGLVMGSLSFVSSSWKEIIVHVHDYVNDEWRIQHKIANIFGPTYSSRYLNPGMPLFFDGENLFFQVKEIHDKETAPIRFYVYEITRKKWEYKTKGFRTSHFFMPFVPFLPTFTKVFDSDLHSDDDGRLQKIYKGLKIKGADNNDHKVVSKCLNKLRKKLLTV